MCDIAGYMINWCEVSVAVADAIELRIAHRGLVRARIARVHRRLSTFDLREASRRTTSTAGWLMLVFDGETNNQRTLRFGAAWVSD
jgi:asparagine synthetase B (glutamine-hydrolysing)